MDLRKQFPAWPSRPKRKKAAVKVMGEEIMPGIVVAPTACPNCQGKMIVRSCPCFLRKNGFTSCARCLNPKCATIIGLKKRGR